MTGSSLSASSDGKDSVEAKTYGVSAGMYFNRSAELPDAAFAPEIERSAATNTADARLANLIMFTYPKSESRNSTYVSAARRVAVHIRTIPQPVAASIISVTKTSKVAIADGLYVCGDL